MAGAASRRRRPAADGPGDARSPGSPPRPTARSACSAWPRSPAGGSTTTCSPRSSDLPEHELTEGLRTAIDRQLLVQDGRRRGRRATRSAMRSSRRRPTTTSCPASGGRSIAPTPRPSRTRPAARARAARPTGPSSPTTGRPPATTSAPRRPRSGPATRPSRRTPSPPRSSSSSWRSSSGTASRIPWTTLGIDRVDAPRAGGERGRGRRRVPPRRRSSSARRSRSRTPSPIRSRARSSAPARSRALADEGAEPSLAIYAEAIAMLPAHQPSADRARVLAGMGQILMLVDRFAEAIAMCEEAVAMARAVGDRQVEGHALNTLGLGLGRARPLPRGDGRARDRPRDRPRARAAPTTSPGPT